VKIGDLTIIAEGVAHLEAAHLPRFIEGSIVDREPGFPHGLQCSVDVIDLDCERSTTRGPDPASLAMLICTVIC
jgi:hypothetical protein